MMHFCQISLQLGAEQIAMYIKLAILPDLLSSVSGLFRPHNKYNPNNIGHSIKPNMWTDLHDEFLLNKPTIGCGTNSYVYKTHHFASFTQ